MTIDISSLPTGQPINVRWVKQGEGFSVTEEAAGRDQTDFTPAQPGTYYGVAWTFHPIISMMRAAFIWLDKEQRFGFIFGYHPTGLPPGQPQYKEEAGGAVGTFQSFTV